jgi:AcrR family transcriptional regulator
MNMTENNIRLAAIKLISRNGYGSMSLRQLATEAGINASTLYLYYKGKNELLLELILEYFQGLSREWTRRRPKKAVTADVKLLAWGCGQKLGLVMPRSPGFHDTQWD